MTGSLQLGRAWPWAAPASRTAKAAALLATNVFRKFIFKSSEGSELRSVSRLQVSKRLRGLHTNQGVPRKCRAYVSRVTELLRSSKLQRLCDGFVTEGSQRRSRHETVTAAGRRGRLMSLPHVSRPHRGRRRGHQRHAPG